jgi:pantoate--beta-alanine ligase
VLQFKNSEKLSDYLYNEKSQGNSVGFVPTMGALHKGHLSLIKQALLDCKIVVCSIFVNPTQFNNASDLSNYPIDIDRDIEKLESVGCNIVFIPSVAEIYPEKLDTIDINLDGIDIYLEGEHRPGHFAGVVTVVNKFFNIIEPNRAYFGQKDFQQYSVIKKMAEQLNQEVEVIMSPTMREQDGLAMSTRNRRLTVEHREKAPLLFIALNKAQQHSSTKSVVELLAQMKQDLSEEKEIELDYIEIADMETLEPITDWGNRKEAQIFIAAFLGGIRLIDNITLRR